jgi:alpha-glucosidase
VGFLAPFFRNHKVIDGYDQEPWRFGQHYEDVIRKYLKLRYELLPFLYSTLEEAHRTGVPLFRPLVLNYQEDANTYNLDDEFMIGNDLLVAPVLAAGQTQRLVYLPSGVWYDYWTNKRYDGGKMIRIEAPLETVPMFVRGGAIIPKAPAMNHVNEKPRDPISFEIYPDDQGNAATILYEDDGVSPAYKAGAFRRTHISVTRTARTYRVSIAAPEGKFVTPRRKFNLVIKPSGRQQTVVDNSQPKIFLIR